MKQNLPVQTLPSQSLVSVAPQQETNKKRIYIILTQPHTVLAKLIKLFSKTGYNHASIALEENIQTIYHFEMYSFGRKRVHNPVWGGFVKESCNFGFFQQYPETNCAVYAIEVSDQQYEHCKQQLCQFINHAEEYKYNHLGLLAIPLRIPYSPAKHFVCSHFVAHLLQKNHIVHFYKDIRLVTPWDLAHIAGIRPVYYGRLQWLPEALQTAV